MADQNRNQENSATSTEQSMSYVDEEAHRIKIVETEQKYYDQAKDITLQEKFLDLAQRIVKYKEENERLRRKVRDNELELQILRDDLTNANRRAAYFESQWNVLKQSQSRSPNTCAQCRQKSLEMDKLKAEIKYLEKQLKDDLSRDDVGTGASSRDDVSTRASTCDDEKSFYVEPPEVRIIWKGQAENQTQLSQSNQLQYVGALADTNVQ